MNSLKILIDMDDTIEHLLISWVDYINKRYGTTVKYEDVTEWDLRVAFPKLTKKQLHSLLEEEEFWKTVRPMDGAAETIRWMLDQGHEVYIVTASAYRTIQPKMEHVLFKYFPFLTWNNVIITAHKQMIQGDVLIDDAPHNLIGGKYIKVLMDAPHNQSFDAEANGMCRVKNWAEVQSIIEGLQLDYEISKKVQDIAYQSRRNPEWFIKEYFGVELTGVQKTLLRFGVELTGVQKTLLRFKSKMLGF